MLVRGAADLGVTLDDIAVGRFERYRILLQLWGRKMNLTTRLSDSDIVVYHFLDSLAGCRVLRETPQARVVDLGAGAGLPSLPLKFAIPGLQVVLVESSRKKVAFCAEVVRSVGLSGIRVEWGRGDEVGAREGFRGSFDWAVSRALGAAADVVQLALPFLAAGGRIMLYKGDLDDAELRGLDVACERIHAVYEIIPVDVPHLGKARCLVVVRFAR